MESLKRQSQSFRRRLTETLLISPSVKLTRNGKMEQLPDILPSRISGILIHVRGHVGVVCVHMHMK